MKRAKLLLKTTAVAAVLALGLSACGATGSKDSSQALPKDIKTIKLGVADAGESYWNVFKQKAKEKYGVDVQLVNFSDYNQPNPALVNRAIDMNEFQHLQYLANYNVQNKQNLKANVATAVYPLPLYSKKYKSVKDIHKGDKIAIPNNPVNLARALKVLEDAKLVKLTKKWETTTTLAQVDKKDSKVELVPVDSKQTAQQLGSVAGAVVNNNYATAAKLTEKDIIAKDNPNAESAKPYINAFVVRDADKDNETLKKVAELYHDPDVEKAIARDLGKDGVFKNNSSKDLQDTTTKIENEIKKAGGKK